MAIKNMDNTKLKNVLDKYHKEIWEILDVLRDYGYKPNEVTMQDLIDVKKSSK